MKNKESNGKMWTRKDTFEAMQAGETMPGRLQWSVGYFTKVRLMDSQVAHKRKFIRTVRDFLVYSRRSGATSRCNDMFCLATVNAAIVPSSLALNEE